MTLHPFHAYIGRITAPLSNLPAEENSMIARTWHGRTAIGKADKYLKFLIDRSIPDYQSIADNRGVTILRRLQDTEAHFLILTLWESRAAIAAFAGADIEQAKYYAEDQVFLLEFEPTVTHYEVCAVA
jgi:heme-degrading monooxygenase HmoA